MLGPPQSFLDTDDPLWTPYEARLILFMNTNSIAVAMWAYFP